MTYLLRDRPFDRWGKIASSIMIAGLLIVFTAGLLSAQTTLEYWIWDNNQLPAVLQMVEAFEEAYPHIEVNTTVVGWGEYWEKSVVAMLAGAGPDVLWMTMYDLINWIHRGLIEDLTPRIESDATASQNFDIMWPILREAYTYQGKIWGMPRDFDSIAVMYNQNHVAEAGLPDFRSVDDQWTTDDFADYAKKLTRMDGDETSRWGTVVLNAIQDGYAHIVRAYGGEFFSEDGNQMIVDSEESREAIQYLHDLVHVHGAAVLDGTGPFEQGRASSITLGNWNLKWLSEALPVTQVAQMPFAVTTGERSTTVHGLADVINPYSPNKDAAFEFIKFLSSYEAQSVLGISGTVIPSRQDASLLYFETDVLPETSTAYLDGIAYGSIFPSTPYLSRSDWNGILDDLVGQAIRAEISVAEALSSAQSQINSLIEESRNR